MVVDVLWNNVEYISRPLTHTVRKADQETRTQIARDHRMTFTLRHQPKWKTPVKRKLAKFGPKLDIHAKMQRDRDKMCVHKCLPEMLRHKAQPLCIGFTSDQSTQCSCVTIIWVNSSPHLPRRYQVETARQPKNLWISSAENRPKQEPVKIICNS